MNYNRFELNLLKGIRKKRYCDLEEWEKFYLKSNVKLHRQKKWIVNNELSVDSQVIDVFFNTKQENRKEDY